MNTLTIDGDWRRLVAILTLAGFLAPSLGALGEVSATQPKAAATAARTTGQTKLAQSGPASPLAAFLNLTPDQRAAAFQQMQSAVQQALSGSTYLSTNDGKGGPEVSTWNSLSETQRKALLTNFQTRLAQAAGSQPNLVPPGSISPEARAIMEGLQPDQQAALMQGLGGIITGILQDPAMQSFIAAARSGTEGKVSFFNAKGEPVPGDFPVHVVPANPSGQFPAPSGRIAPVRNGDPNHTSGPAEGATKGNLGGGTAASPVSNPPQAGNQPALRGEAIAQEQSSNNRLLSLVSGLMPVIADSDADGLPDSLEKALADGFTPTYSVSSDDPDVFATFNNALGPDCNDDGYRDEQVQTLYGLTPISYYRVTPQPELFGHNGMGYIRIDYLTLWNQDSGLVSTPCWDDLNLLGINIQSLTSHCNDQEHSATLVAAPLVNGKYDTTAADYKACQFYTARHEFTLFDGSVFLCPSSPFPYGYSIHYWLSKSKHSTYNFNPDGYSIVPPWFQAAIYSAIAAFYVNCVASCWDPDCQCFDTGCVLWCTAKYSEYEAAAAFIINVCIIEGFHGPGGGVTAGLRINVGETSRVLNSCGFILANDILQKLATDYFSPHYSPCP